MLFDPRTQASPGHSPTGPASPAESESYWSSAYPSSWQITDPTQLVGSRGPPTTIWDAEDLPADVAFELLSIFSAFLVVGQSAILTSYYCTASRFSFSTLGTFLGFCMRGASEQAQHCHLETSTVRYRSFSPRCICGGSSSPNLMTSRYTRPASWRRR